MAVLEAYDLYRFYHTDEEETLALRGVSIEAAAGEMVVIMGPSGSGKSTLLSCLAGIDEPDGGYVRLYGERITRRTEGFRAAKRAQGIGYVLQTRNLIDHLSVEENVEMKMWLCRDVNRDRVKELLELVSLTERAKSLPPNLSGGEAARAAIAVALATGPKILLADEPTGEVDAETEIQIIDLFHSYCKSGGAAVLASHSAMLASHADRIIHLLDGRVVDEVQNSC